MKAGHDCPERLETDRLVLRRPAVADAGAIFARYASDPEVTKFPGWPRRASVDETLAHPFKRCHSGLGFDTAHRAATG